jgi:hypothetical protein
MIQKGQGLRLGKFGILQLICVRIYRVIDCPGKIGFTEIAIVKNSSSQVRSGEVGSRQVGIGEVGISDYALHKMSPSDIKVGIIRRVDEAV